MERILIGPSDAPSTEILIGADLVSSFDPGTVALRKGSRVAVLTQPGAARHARSVARRLRAHGVDSSVRTLPDRDAAKNMGVVEECYLWLNELRFTRSDVIVAVGGGALTDVAGFVAATYLRGIDVVYVPTTLLGAVDAAIGGKTGVNAGGKNLAGVFRHPRLVLVDTDLLAQLPEELLREGAAEALKAGLIADPDLVAMFERHGLDAPIAAVVPAAVRIKADVVTGDFLEQGRRAILNYGHTVGHAVEVVGALSHGHAISIGMVAAGAASEAVTGFGEAERQREVIAGLGLPVAAPAVAREAVLRLIDLDKKRDIGGLRMVLLESIGHATVAPVDPATVGVALAAVGIV